MEKIGRGLVDGAGLELQAPTKAPITITRASAGKCAGIVVFRALAFRAQSAQKSIQEQGKPQFWQRQIWPSAFNSPHPSR